MSRYARRIPAAIIAVAFVAASFVSAAGNPACAHHSGIGAHSTGHDSATIHAHADHTAHEVGANAESAHDSESSPEHGSEPCNCPTLCQNPTTLASLQPTGSQIDLPDLFPVAVPPASTPEPGLETADFLHPFPNPPPIV